MTSHTVADNSDNLGNGWRDEAACLEHPAEWFTGPHAPGDTRRAIDVCNTCPVKQPCLATALQFEVSADLGIWGGTTPTTRRRLRREHPDRAPVIDAEPRPVAKPPPVEGTSIRAGKLELVRDEHGDHVDQTGRVIIFEIHGQPPYMLMIDGQPRARTTTVAHAAGLAAHFISAPERAHDRREIHMPEQPATRHTETTPHRR